MYVLRHILKSFKSKADVMWCPESSSCDSNFIMCWYCMTSVETSCIRTCVYMCVCHFIMSVDIDRNP